MTQIYKLTAHWSGWQGAPGYTVLYYSDVPNPAHLSTFFDSIKLYLPSSVSVAIPGSGNIINDTNGTLVGTWSNTAGTTRTGTGSGGMTSVAGMTVKWITSTIVRGRILIGRSFLVPMAVTAFGSDGTIDSAAITTVGNAASALVTAGAGELIVWSRPTYDEAGEIDETGSHGPVMSSSAVDKQVHLRTRRD